MLSICWDSVGVVCARPFSVPLGYLKGWSEFLQLKHDKAKFRHPTNLKYNAPDNCLAEAESIGVVAMLIMTLLPTPITQATYTNTPPSQPGFPVMLAGAPVDLSSPTLADLDGDGKLEIIVGGRDITNNGAVGCGGWVYAYRSNGTLYWQTHVQAPVNASPTVADLNKDGKPEVIVGLGGVPTGTICWNGGVAALNGQNGSAIWSFATQDWLGHHADGWKDGVFSSPAVVISPVTAGRTWCSVRGISACMRLITTVRQSGETYRASCRPPIVAGMAITTKTQSGRPRPWLM